MIVLESDPARLGAYSWGWEWGDQFTIYWTKADHDRWVQVFEEQQAELKSAPMRYAPEERRTFEEERREALALRSYR